jgi:DegV family protein with EDD domain
MTGVRIVTDSACDLNDNQVAELGITVVPLTIRFGSDELTDRVELSVEDFYRRMSTSDDLPETAAPAPGAFQDAFTAARDDGADAVVCIDLSEDLSATIGAARNGATGVDDFDIRVVNSGSVSSGLGTQVRLAAAAAKAGADADEIVALVEALRARTRVFAALDGLDNLKKGGRIGGATALLGTMLSVKPVIDLSTGVVEEAAKPRTRRKAMEWLRDRLFSDGACDEVTIASGMAPEVADFAAMLSARYPADQLAEATIGAVIGSHGGPRIIGLTYLVPD